MRKNTVSLLHRVKYISYLALAILVCMCCLGWFTSGPQASPVAPTPNVQAVSLVNGVAVLNEDKGSVIFCSFTSNSGSPPTPTGKCTSMGTVGKSATGYIMTPSGSNAFVNNKATGGIFQCTTLIVNGQPFGACKEIGNLSLF